MEIGQTAGVSLLKSGVLALPTIVINFCCSATLLHLYNKNNESDFRRLEGKIEVLQLRTEEKLKELQSLTKDNFERLQKSPEVDNDFMVEGPHGFTYNFN